MRILLFVGMALLLTACGEKKSETVAEVEEKSIAVSTVPVNKAEISEIIDLHGELVPFAEVQVFSPVNGIITEKKVTVNDRIKSGDLLMRIRQDMPGMDFEPVELRATAAGIVTVDPFETGARINVQQPLLTVSDISKIYLEVKLLQKDLSRIGKTAQVTVSALPNHVFTGPVAEIAPRMDPVSRTTAVKIRLENDNGQFKPGMYAEARMQAGTHSALVVPVDALVQKGVQHHLFVIRGGRAVRLPVTAGIHSGELIEISGEVQENERVIVRGNHLVQDNSPVTDVGGQK
jgi:multidrug efflux pump subunit AcrA (membrane-fusion protein)